MMSYNCLEHLINYDNIKCSSSYFSNKDIKTFRYNTYLELVSNTLFIDIKFISKSKENCFPLFIKFVSSLIDSFIVDSNKKEINLLIDKLINNKDFINNLNDIPVSDINIMESEENIYESKIINISKKKIY